MSNTQQTVDHSALRTNQTFIIGLLVVGFVVSAPFFVGLVAAVLLAGTFIPQAALFKQVYFRLLKPRGWVAADVQADDPAPHQFAQLLGGLVSLAAFIALAAGANGVGWGLAWLVVGLAALNLVAGFCAGCFVYYQLSRANVPGFAPRTANK